MAAALSAATPLLMQAPAPAAAVTGVETPTELTVAQPVAPAPVVIPEALFIPEVTDDIAEDTLIEPEEDDSDLYSISNFTV